MPAFRAIRVVGRARRPRPGRPAGGRRSSAATASSRLLKDLVHATGAREAAASCRSSALAGSGKSRLHLGALEVPRRRRRDVWWHAGRSPAYGEGITFWALGEMVRGRAGLAETDDEATTRAKLAEADRPLGAGRGGAALDRDRAARAARARQRDRDGPRGAVRGLADVLRADRRARARSCWCSRTSTGPTRARSTSSTTWSSGAAAVPILVITLARPELLERRPDWGAGRRNFVSLGLEPLSDAAIHELLRALVPGLPRRRAAGHRRARRRHPAVRGRDDPDARRGGPPRARRTAATRRRRPDQPRRPGDAPRADRRAAGRAARRPSAAVDPGRRRARPELHARRAGRGRAASSATQVDELARSLVRRELLVHDLDPRSAERGQYAFVQALIREVAYGTLARRDRRIRHLAAARFFESLGEDELAGALAVALPRAPTAPRRTIRTAGRSRRRRGSPSAPRPPAPAALGSHDQAMVFLIEAIEVTEDPTEIAELLERAGVAAIHAGRLEQAEPTAARRDRAARGARRPVGSGARDGRCWARGW